jgi:putative colanic acid biosynthesis acetyltransferase WcaF
MTHVRPQVDLSRFNNAHFPKGAGPVIRLLWYVVNALFFLNPLFPFRSVKPILLRLFGASVGKDVVIHPGVNIKFPWKLTIGNHCWIGQRAWLDNIDQLILEDHVVISQGAMIVLGSHDYKHVHYPTLSAPVRLERGSWVGAGAIVTLGVTLKQHSVLAAGSVATKDLEAYTVYQGNPAVAIRERTIAPA